MSTTEAVGDWQLIETAPKDGSLVFSVYKRRPVLVAWLEMPGPLLVSYTGWGLFKKRHETRGKKECGWRILLLGRDLTYNVHGNYGPIELTHWLPFQQFQSQEEDKDG